MDEAMFESKISGVLNCSLPTAEMVAISLAQAQLTMLTDIMVLGVCMLEI
jgi:hypothetical protein